MVKTSYAVASTIRVHSSGEVSATNSCADDHDNVHEKWYHTAKLAVQHLSCVRAVCDLQTM